MPYIEHPTREGKVYCCSVLDAYSRRVVGWSIDSSPDAALVTNALGMAIDGRRPAPGALILSGTETRFDYRPAPSCDPAVLYAFLYAIIRRVVRLSGISSDAEAEVLVLRHELARASPPDQAT